jgi:arabinogalactan endo-1,4-beta-galactosidase
MNSRIGPLPRAVLCAALVVTFGACSSTGITLKAEDAGGATAAGGAAGSGGAKGRGGTPGSGGAPGTGGLLATGGTQSAGGKAGTSGANPTGGATAADAGVGTGGRSGTGGTTSVDAGIATGGRTGTGGTAGVDAGTATGGRTSLGGTMGPDAGTGGRSGTGGITSAGGSTGRFTASYYIGADISFAESAPAAAQDNLLSQLKQHGFNAIRLRTFVDPKASDGYDRTNGNCDIAHTVAFGKKAKDLGLALLVDFHYSDNWADPGKQCVPVAWQSYTTIDDLAQALYDYTKDSITKLIAGGARPEMVQIGNETTPGMLLHVCDSGGQPTGTAKVTGSASNWTNLGKLFKAGIKGVKDVDPTILTALHIDKGGDKATETPGSALNTSKTYINNAIKQGVELEVFGESCYQRYQGDPNSTTTTKSGWANTFAGLATAFPDIKLMAAEYGPMQREINDVVFGLPKNQGIGTFNWEPDQSGDWNTGHVLFTRSGNTWTAGADVALYDQMKVDYASRL